METRVETLIATALPWLATLIAGLSSVAFIGGGAARLGSILEIQFRPVWLRIAGVLLSGAMVCTSFLGWPYPWSLALSCLGLLFSVQAAAIEFARPPSLHDNATRRQRRDSPGWWPEFEKSFWASVSPRSPSLLEPPRRRHDVRRSRGRSRDAD